MRNDFPEGSKIVNFLPADYSDTLSYEVEAEIVNPDDVQVAFWTKSPKWIEVLFKIRGALVKLVGLEGGGRDVEALEASIREGGSHQMMSVAVKTNNETILRLDDSHLSAYISIYVQNLGKRQKVSAITLVQFHNTLGHIYFFFIKPFHYFVVKQMLKRAVKVSIMKTFISFAILFHVALCAFSQDLVAVKDRVLDDKGKPDFSSSIYEKGNVINTVNANAAGDFTIDILPKSKLIFGGHVSYIRQEVTPNKEKFLNIVMQERGADEEYEEMEGFYQPKGLIPYDAYHKKNEVGEYAKTFTFNRMLFDCQNKQMGRLMLFPVGTVGTGYGFTAVGVDHNTMKAVVVGEQKLRYRISEESTARTKVEL